MPELKPFGEQTAGTRACLLAGPVQGDHVWQLPQRDIVALHACTTCSHAACVKYACATNLQAMRKGKVCQHASVATDHAGRCASMTMHSDLQHEQMMPPTACAGQSQCHVRNQWHLLVAYVQLANWVVPVDNSRGALPVLWLAHTLACGSGQLIQLLCLSDAMHITPVLRMSPQCTMREAVFLSDADRCACKRQQNQCLTGWRWWVLV